MAFLISFPFWVQGIVTMRVSGVLAGMMAGIGGTGRKVGDTEGLGGDRLCLFGH